MPLSGPGNLAQVQSRAGQMLDGMAGDAERYLAQKEAARLAREKRKGKRMRDSDKIRYLYTHGRWPSPAEQAGY